MSPPHPPTRVFVLAVVLLKELLFKHMTGGPEEKTTPKPPRPPAPSAAARHSFPKDDDDDQTERNGAPLVRSQQTCPPCFWGLQISIQSSFNNTTNVNILFPS